MSNVIRLFNDRAQHAADPTLERLEAIRDILSELDVPNLTTPTQLLRALWMLDIANTNIQLVLTDLRAVPDPVELVGESEKLASLIEFARGRIAALGAGLAAGAGPGRGHPARRIADC
jgi:hypothetical protein